MAEPPRSPDPKPPSRPRWVKVFGIIAIVVVLLFVVMLVADGEHGPSRHLPGEGKHGGHTPSVEHSP